MSGELARALRVAAQLLAYPDATLYERLPLLTEAAASCGAATAPLTRVCTGLASTPQRDAETRYVDTFDLRRRCCLYLTYYSHGDTRNRGMALLRFSTAYKVAGFEVTDGELPDHLAVVCEFMAYVPDAGLELFRKHRAGLELLRMALADAQSPYLDVVDAIRAVLPDAAPKDMEKALALARSGPPAEEVGLEPFGPPELTGGRR
ncbi:MAG TPA: nitrate reductase molybdenum cofactor assembly chaperone [Mycobacteriales bacterium]|jgi:nitrate reductase delta subunit|nr:nitrate reductase molybdenum cofactor assembly chaperone [Mycobacteriales bacterium]